ncbi:MAG: hypothetical protein ABH869_03255, partial [Candidatus Omnitrophota bacterium]
MLNDMTAKAIEIIFMAENGFVVKEDYKSKEEHFKEARFYFLAKKIIQKDKNRANYFSDDFWQAKLRSGKIRKALKKGHVFYQTGETGVVSELGDKVDAETDERKIIESMEKSLKQLTKGQGSFADEYLADQRKKFERWFIFGKGLKKGDRVQAFIDPGDFERFNKGRKIVLENGKENDRKPNVLFFAENDENHGFVVNCYLINRDNKDAISRVIATFMYFSEYDKVKIVDLGAMDVICVAYDLKKSIKPLNRSFIARINSLGHVNILLPKETGLCPWELRLQVPKNKKYEGEKVAITVEVDENQRLVINMYLMEQMSNGKKAVPIRSYILIKGKKGKNKGFSKAVPVDTLARLDILDASEGKQLKLLGRELEVNISIENEKMGACNILFLKQSEHARKTSFVFPRFYKGRDICGELAVVRVEKTMDQGQVINVYLKSELENEESSKPLPRRKNSKIDIPESEDLLFQDIMAYQRGIEVNPVEGRVLEMPVIYGQASGVLEAIKQKGRNGIQTCCFRLWKVAKYLFVEKERQHQKAWCGMREHKDYGPYIELYKGHTVISQYYYFKHLEECKMVDFARMSIIDYAMGNKNIHGRDVTPEMFYYPGKIKKTGSLDLSYKGKQCILYRLTPLVGKQPVFVPEVDAEHRYKIYVHDAEEYKKDKKRIPEITLARCSYFNALIPIEMVDIYKAKENVGKGNYYNAVQILEDFIIANPKNPEAKKLFNETINIAVKEFLDKGYFCLAAVFLKKQISILDAYMKNKPKGANPKETLEFIYKKLEEYKRSKEDLEVFLDGKNKDVCACAEILFSLAREPHLNIEVSLARKIAVFFGDHQGAQKNILSMACKIFFQSIADTYIFKKQKGEMDVINGNFLGEKDPVALYLRDLRRVPLLTELGEIKLGMLTQLGSEDARNRFVESNLRIVLDVIKRKYQWAEHVIDDLVAVGNEGLICAVKGYKPWMENKFFSYADVVIGRAITTYISEKAGAMRIPVKDYSSALKFNERCREKNLDPDDIAISSDEIADQLGMAFREVEFNREILFFIFGSRKPISFEEETRSDVSIEDKTYIKKERAVFCESIMAKYIIPWIAKKWEDDPVSLKIAGYVLKTRIIPTILYGSPKKSFRQAAKEDGLSRSKMEKIDVLIWEKICQIEKQEKGREVFESEDEDGVVPGAAISETLRVICDSFISKDLSFKEFNKSKELYPLRKEYNPAVVDIGVRILRKLNILIMTKPGVYRLNTFLKGDTLEETYQNIAAIYNLKFRTEKKDKPLDRYEIPEQKILAVKERVRMELAHRLHLKAGSANAKKETRE